MAEELFIPKLGQTVEEVTLIEWTAKDGEKVRAGQGVLKVETDKAVFDVEATGSGYLHVGPFETGEVIPVLTVVAIIGKKDDAFRDNGRPEPAPQAVENADSTPESEPMTAQNSADWIFASPIARKMAQKHNIDLAAITPTGRRGKTHHSSRC